MTRLDLVELGDWTDVRLDPATGQALAASQVVETRPTPYDAGLWQVRALAKVGVAKIASVELRIAPKIPIRRLFFLLGYVRNPRGWREHPVEVGEESGLLPALAYAFERQADRAVRQGILQGYRYTEDALPVIRGRLRYTDQLRDWQGLPVPLEVSYDEFTVDIPENQLLLAATERLLRLAGVAKDVRHRLLRLRLRFTDVSRLVRGRPLPTWRLTSLNERYETALGLAEIVLREASIEHAEGAVRVDGFLLNMAQVFEDFITTALAESLSPHGGRCRFQATHHLDEDNRIRMKPDLVWYDADRRPLAVADAKYKAEKPAGFPDADLYQMLAYCTALNLAHGHLVYAKGNEPQAQHTVRNAGVTILQHALDLNQAPSALLTNTARIANEMLGLTEVITQLQQQPLMET
ncbi:restriction endonuclease [Streptomyces sp. NPDC004647]|uniref:McrC family protein n=1 Tax=Streptomyces sp. NPDC004647 TaxID=3154671 RepID=UPI0033B74FAB